ncbi:MAG: UDP-N-acetylmuramoyl-tripeptide--D-alanyl-D-alanine ligase, partial [Candidatus Eisenbacteria bacterium]
TTDESDIRPAALRDLGAVGMELTVDGFASFRLPLLGQHTVLNALAALGMPSIGVITNAAVAHLENFGTVREVARAKSELAEELGKDDWLIIHRDSEELYRENRARRCGIITFGTSDESDIRPAALRDLGADGMELTVDGFASFRLPLLGKHNVLNALAALGASRALGVPSELAVGALATVRPGKGRMELKTVGPATFIDDSYNANPVSTEAALETLFSLSGFERRAAVLGGMLELGETAEEWHERLGAQAGRADMVFLVGRHAEAVRRGAVGTQGRHTVLVCDSHADAAQRIMAVWQKGDIFLVKGSRGAEMEKVLEELEKRAGAAGPNNRNATSANAKRGL